MGAGARLCTSDEIHADDTRYTGCAYDARYVWTSTTRHNNIECPRGQVMATIGSSEFRNEPPVCTDMLDPRINVALGKFVIADTELLNHAPCTGGDGNDCAASGAVDGLFGNDHRWVSTPDGTDHWLAVDLAHRYHVTAVNVYAGWDIGGDAPGSPDYNPSQVHHHPFENPQFVSFILSLDYECWQGLCKYQVQKHPSLDDDLLASPASIAAAESGWVTVFEHLEHTASQVHDDFGTAVTRYMRLKIDQSGTCDGVNVGNYARIYEFQVLSTVATRCCADNIRKCYDEGSGGVTATVTGGSGGGCAADSSLYLCGELGWSTKATWDAHVGGSTDVCGESDGMVSTHAISTTN